jgi:hypothetical protein
MTHPNAVMITTAKIFKVVFIPLFLEHLYFSIMRPKLVRQIGALLI